MTLADAHPLISQTLARMHAAYGAPVFNEWVLISHRGQAGAITAYDGPRLESYRQQFTRDLASMLAELAQQKLGIGDFAFADTAEGTHFDACIRLGATSFLFCNNTHGTMKEIRANPLWLHAQKPWVDLCEKFAADPLE